MHSIPARIAILVAVCGLPLVCAAEGISKSERSRLKLAEREIERREKLTEWARRTKPTPERRFRETFAPIYEGNRRDFERNRELATKFRQRAETAATRQQIESARKYATVAKLFAACAEHNRMIVQSLETRDSETIDTAFAKLRECEGRILEITGQRVEREWFMPEELARYRMLIAQRQRDEDDRDN